MANERMWSGQFLVTRDQLVAGGGVPGERGMDRYNNGRPERIAPERTAPQVQAAPTAITPAANWNAAKFGALYQMRDTLNLPQPILDGLDQINDYVTSGAAIPTEVGGWLDGLGLGDVLASGITPAAAAAPEPAAGEAQYYGLTADAWNSLDTWQKLSMRVMGSGAVQGVGNALGWMADNVPAFQTFLNVLDAPAQAVQRVIGLGVLANEVGLDEVWQNLDNALTAAGHLYQATTIQDLLGGTNSAGFEPLGVAGMGPQAEAWQFGTAQTQMLAPEQTGVNALVEYLERRNAGETEAALDAEYEQRFGFQGMMRSMLGMMVADPLNFLGGALAKGAGVATKAALEGTDIAQDATKLRLLTSAFDHTELIQGIKRFNAVAGEVLTYDEWKEMPGLLRFVAPVYDSTGMARVLDTTKGILGGAVKLTPETRARRGLDIHSKTFSNWLSRFDNSEDGLRQMDQTLAALEKGDIKEALALSNRMTGGADFGLVQTYWKDTGEIKKLRGMIADYLTPENAAMREAFADAVQKAGTTWDDAVKQLTTKGKELDNARVLLAKAGETALTEDGLAAAAKYFASSDGAGDIRQLFGKIYATSSNDIIPWAAKYFGVEQDKAWVRWSNLVKSAQGMVLLDANPTYLLQNIVDNNLKLLREGMVFSRNAQYWLPGRMEKLLKRVYGENVPTFLREGLGSEYGGRKVDAITKAMEPAQAGMPEKLGEVVSAGRKYSPIKALSNKLEPKMRAMGAAVKYTDAWRPNWKRGRALTRMSREVEASLGPEITEQVYRIMERSMNHDEMRQGIEALLKGEYVKTVDDAVDDLLHDIPSPDQMREALEKSGTMDKLRELPPEFSQEQLNQKVKEIAQDINKQAEAWHKAQKAQRMEQAANVAKNEGALGMTIELDDALQMRVDQRLADIQALENVFDPKNARQRTALYDIYQQTTRGAYRRLEENVQAIYTGMVDALGADSKYSRDLILNLHDEFEGWKEFFDTTGKDVREFFRKHKDKWDDAAWQALKDTHAEMYNRMYSKALDLTATRNAWLKELLVSHYGQDIAGQVDEWIKATTDLQADMFKKMEDFRTSLRAVRSEPARAKMWDAFWAEHKQRLMTYATENRTRLNALHAAADNAERAGVAPIATGAAAAARRSGPPSLAEVEAALAKFSGKGEPDEVLLHNLRNLMQADQSDLNNAENLRIMLENPDVQAAIARNIGPVKMDVSIDKAKAAADAKAALTPEIRAKAKALRAQARADRPMTADEFVQQARELKLWEATGLDDAARQRVMDVRQIAAEFGIPSADEAGKPVKGFDTHVKNILKKYGEDVPDRIEDVDPAALRRALEKRAGIGLSPSEIVTERPRHELPPEVSEAIRRQAEILNNELWQGEPGKRIFTWREDQSQPVVTGQSSTHMQWYRDLYFEKKMSHKQVENGLKRIIEDGTMDKPELKNVREMKNLIIDRLMNGYTDPLTGVEMPPDPAVLIWMGETDAAAKALNDLIELGWTSWEDSVRWAGSEAAADALLKRLAEVADPSELVGSNAPVATFPEPAAADVNALALALEQDAIDEALAGWRTGAGLPKTEPKPITPEPLPEVPAAIPDPDPVGIAPPGTVASLAPEPVARMYEEGMQETVIPFLQRLQAAYPDAARRTQYGTLTPEQVKAIRAHLEVASGDMSDMKLAATKYAQVATDEAMLDYNRRYGFDTLLGGIVPYQFWFTRSAMNWALSAIDHPAWYSQWARLRSTQDKLANETPGFPSRLAGKMQIPLPFMPEGWGNTVYVDPWHQVFGFEAMASQVIRPLMRDNMNRESRAQYILEEMARNGEISEQQAAQAIQQRAGDLWQRAMIQAESDVQAEIESPLDLVGTMFSPSLPIQWALERAGLVKNRNRGPGTYPLVSTFQNLTSFITPGGVNLYEKFQSMIGAAQGDVSSNARGFLWDYYVARELSNMAAHGADVDEVKLAMTQKSGPLYEQATRTIGLQQAVRSFSSLLWADFFPEGEERQRKLQPVFEQYAEAGKLTAFFDKYPEYEARMQRNNWDDPDAMMSTFLRAQVWDGWNKLSQPEKKEAQAQLGELFTDAFLNKETRSYDSINLETWVQWAQALGGTVPENAPEAQPLALKLPDDAVTQAYAEYRNLPGNQFASLMYSMPPAIQAQMRAQYPELSAYEDQKSVYLMQHPELLPYVSGEKYQGATPEVLQEIYTYRGMRAMYFPGISYIQDAYYDLPKAQRRSYLAQHPELKDYWDWNEQAVNDLSSQAYYYYKGESAIDKLRYGDDYQEPYRPDYSYLGDYSQLDPMSPYVLLTSAAMTGRINPGTERMLHDIYAREQPGIDYYQWVQVYLDGFRAKS